MFMNIKLVWTFLSEIECKGQGNVFTGVCLSTGVGWSAYRGVCIRGDLPRQSASGGPASRGVCLQGVCILRGSTSGVG